MMKVLLLAAVALTFKAHTPELCVSYIVDFVWVKEMATPIAATKEPSPKEVPSHPKDGTREDTLSEPLRPESVGHIDQHDYGGRWGPASSIPGSKNVPKKR